MRTKTYDYQFHPVKNAAIAYNKEYEVYLDWEKKHLKDKESWQKEMNRLSELSATGTVVDGFTWQQMDKQLEQLSISRDHRQLGQQRLALTVAYTFQMLAGFFSDILEDYEGGKLAKDQLVDYLKGYQEVIDSGNGLKCFSEPPVDKILDAINKNLN